MNTSLSRQVIKAVTSGAYFTRTDSQTTDDRELMQLNPELYNQRNSKFDSPNNIKGIMITTSGVYVETYSGYGIIDKKDGKAKRTGQRLRYDMKNNNQFVEALNRSCRGRQQFMINNNWMFTPVLQNISYIYFDEALGVIINRDIVQMKQFLQVINEIIMKPSGSQGQPNRQRFPRLKEIGYLPGLGSWMQFSGDKEFLQLQAQHDRWQQEYSRKTNKAIAVVDMETVRNWGKLGSRQARPEIYKYDYLFIQHEKIREMEQNKTRQKEKAKPAVAQNSKVMGTRVNTYGAKSVGSYQNPSPAIKKQEVRRIQNQTQSQATDSHLLKQGQAVEPKRDASQKPRKNNQTIEELKYTNPKFNITADGKYVLNEKSPNTEVLQGSRVICASQNDSLLSLYLRDKVDQFSYKTIAENTQIALKQAQYRIMACGALMNIIADAAGGYRKVHEISLIADNIILNGKLLLLPDWMMDPDGYFQLADVIDFETLFKRFKRLRELRIDLELWHEMREQLDRHGKDRMKVPFRRCKKLEAIYVIYRLKERPLRIQREAALEEDDEPNDEERAVKKINMQCEKYDTTGRVKADARVKRYSHMGMADRGKQARKDIKQEQWGQQFYKVVTITTTLMTYGVMSAAFGPLGFIAGTIMVNNVARKMADSKDSRNVKK